jgi:hypothetical protein
MAKPSKPLRRTKARKDAPAAPEPETTSVSAASPAPPAPPAPDPIDAANLDEAFVKALEADFIAHGKTAIAELRAEKPTDYMKIVAALHAKGASDEVDPFQEMSDAELDRRIEEVAQRAGLEIGVADAPARARAAADQGADAD